MVLNIDKVLIIGCLFFINICLHSQSYTYDLVAKKDTIGVLNVSKKVNAKNQIVYKYETDLTVSLLMKIHIKYSIESIYNEESLIQSIVKTLINGKEDVTSLLWKDGVYQVKHKNKREFLIEEKIKYSSVKLFFEEPKNVIKVFSEYSTKFGTIKNIQKNMYQLTLHNNKQNDYYYDTNKLIKASIDNSHLDFDIILRNN